VLPYARVVDLVVAGRPDPEWAETGRLGIADRQAMVAGRPVLVVPNTGVHSRGGERVLVAWNGRRKAARAVLDALPILRSAERESRLGESAARARAHTRHASGGHLQRVGTARREMREDRAGCTSRRRRDAACLRQRDERRPVGCYGHARLREFVFGGASRHVLSHVAIPVLMSH
jgi:hypothetical protein